MVLTQVKTREEKSSSMKNSAEHFCAVYNAGVADPKQKCHLYVDGSKGDVVKAFKRGEFRTLIIIGRLLEGFDHKPISVVAIARNVQPSSRVLFTQFIGRAVRKVDAADPVKAVVVSHQCYHQRANFNQRDQLAVVEPMRDEDEDEEDEEDEEDDLDEAV